MLRVTARLLSAGLMATLVNKCITHLHETTEASCTERQIITSHDKTLGLPPSAIYQNRTTIILKQTFALIELTFRKLTEL